MDRSSALQIILLLMHVDRSDQMALQLRLKHTVKVLVSKWKPP